MISITDSAKKQVLALMEDDDRSDLFIRVSVESGGCSGLKYNLDFDNTPQDGDKVIEDNGLAIRVDKRSFLYLAGTTLNFEGGLKGKGFVFTNPNAARTCSCGESFSL